MNRKNLIALLKKEVVLCCSALLAIVSACFVPPSAAYWGYIDWPVLSLLLCLMLVVTGWRELGFFRQLGLALSGRAHRLRGLSLTLVGLCFFCSMLITNDVALITFVPFTISLFLGAGLGAQIIPVVVLETIAANLGSMLTPIGNPQNLYLFSLAGWSVPEFLGIMAPLSLLSLLTILGLVLLRPNQELPGAGEQASGSGLSALLKKPAFLLYLGLFLVCLCQVFHLLPYWLVLLIVLLAVAISNVSLLKQADYSLLLTFVCFFIFVGNIQNLPLIRDWLAELVAGRELWLGVAASQVVSNVPAALLLSSFTESYHDLLWGVNIGGLGTLIASMASLISYKNYVNMEGARPGRYMLIFTAYNLLLLAILCLFVLLI